MDKNYIDQNDAAYVYNLFRELEQARTDLDTDAHNNFAAIYGHQYAEWTQLGRYYVNYLALGRGDDRARITINKINPIMKARTTFIIGENPSIYIDSDSPETDDKEASYTAQRVARADWEQNNLYGGVQEAWEWVKSCGVAYIETYYDPNGGEFLGQIKDTGQNVFNGQVKSRIYPSLSVFTDPLASRWDDVQYAIVASVVNIESLDRMGLTLDSREMRGDVYANAPTSVMQMINQLERPELINSQDIMDQKGRKRNVLMLKYFEKPSVTHPGGRFIQVVGNRVVKSGKLLFGIIPLVPFVDSTVAGTVNGRTPVTEMRPIQELLNRVVSLSYERSQLPDIYAFPIGGGFPRKFGSRSVITGEYRPGAGEPKFIQAGVNRPDYIMQMKYYEEQMEQIAGVSSISTRADAPSSMSGRMGYILTDANRVLLSGIRYRFQRSVSDLIRQRLLYMNEFYDDERMMSFINEDDRREIVRFTGKQIGRNWSVSVRIAESVNDPNARAQRILQLFQNPIVVQELMRDPVSMRKALVGIDPEIGHEYFVSETDTDVARDENYEFSQGAMISVMPWNNDEVHKIEHKRQLDSDTLRKWHPVYIENLKRHWFLHEMQEAAKMRQRMAQQQMMVEQAQAQQAQQGQNNTPGVPGAEPIQGGPETPVQAIDQTLEQKTQSAFPGYQPGTAPTQQATGGM